MTERGAHLLARAEPNTIQRPIRQLPAGSYPAKVYTDEAARRRDARGIAVRVIEYIHDAPGAPAPANGTDDH